MADAQPFEIGAWDFHRAGGLLPGVVASAVGYAADGIEQRVHRGLPSPHLTFIITLDEPVVSAFSPDDLFDGGALSTEVLTGGLHTVPAYIRQPVAQSGIQLAIYPLAARRFFRLPPAELTGSVLDGAEVVGREVQRLREQLIETDGWPARFATLERFLRRYQQPSGSMIRPEVAEAWTWLSRHRGSGSIGGLAEHVHLSQRQLRTLFTREFGIGPKTFNRLLRYQHAKRMITDRVEAGKPLDLAGVAGDCGYSDQAHLAREFSELTGTSPTRWVVEEFGTIRAGGHRNDDEAA